VKADSVFLKKNRDHDSLTKIIRDIVDKAGPRKTIIKSWNFFTNDYLDNYIDIHIEVLNPYKKRIKYIKFTFHAFNPVGDPAKDLRSNSHIKTVEGVGPINPLETAEYYFKTVYNTPVLSTLKLKTVTVVFFDSTSAVISDPIEMSME
jgi:hypothetical protein